MGEADGLSLGQMVLDVLLVQGGLLLIVYQDHDNVGSLHRLGGIHNRKTVLFCFCGGFGALIQSYHHIHAGIPQV